MAVGRDFGIIYIEEVIENLRINKITKRKWADREEGQKQNLILRVYMYINAAYVLCVYIGVRVYIPFEIF